MSDEEYFSEGSDILMTELSDNEGDEDGEESDTSFDAHFAPIQSEKSVKRGYQVDFTTKSTREINEIQLHDTDHVSGILGIPKHHAATLLRHFK